MVDRETSASKPARREIERLPSEARPLRLSRPTKALPPNIPSASNSHRDLSDVLPTARPYSHRAGNPPLIWLNKILARFRT